MKQFDTRFDGHVPQIADLKAVLALLQDSTVTRAAQRLGITQSALSYQLERMRKRFADPLFVRVGNRMAPTPLAQGLAEPAARVLRILESEIAALATFDPRTTKREFRIGVNEIGAMTLIPRLVHRMALVAPGARLSPVQVDPNTMTGALESGDIDIVAGHFPKSSGGLLQQLLYKRDYVCVVRRNHPWIGASMTMREFGLAPQVHSSTVTTILEWIDAQLRKRSLDQGVRMLTQHVASIPFIVAAGDHVAVIPREVFDLFAPIAPLKIVRLPVPPPAVAIHQYWHPRVSSDPALRFFREQVLTAATSDHQARTRPAA
jgi:DNA-binding transcriptional LysR family regulator